MDSLTNPIIDQLRNGPPTLDVEDACKCLGFSRSHGYSLVRRGAFPAKVIQAGGRYKVLTASLVHLFEDEHPVGVA